MDYEEKYNFSELQRQINKTLRDHSDPFQLLGENFRQFFRLNREVAFDLFQKIKTHTAVPRRNTKVSPILQIFLPIKNQLGKIHIVLYPNLQQVSLKGR